MINDPPPHLYATCTFLAWLPLFYFTYLLYGWPLVVNKTDVYRRTGEKFTKMVTKTWK